MNEHLVQLEKILIQYESIAREFNNAIIALGEHAHPGISLAENIEELISLLEKKDE